jgi:hypothetical protein
MIFYPMISIDWLNTAQFKALSFPNINFNDISSVASSLAHLTNITTGISRIIWFPVSTDYQCKSLVIPINIFLIVHWLYCRLLLNSEHSEWIPLQMISQISINYHWKAFGMLFTFFLWRIIDLYYFVASKSMILRVNFHM